MLIIETYYSMKSMNRGLLYTLALGLLLAIGGCSKNEPLVVESITLSTHGVAFDSDGGSRTIAVMPFPEDVEWRVVCAEQADWFTVSAADGAIMVDAEVNYSTEQRRGEFSVVSPNGVFESVDVAVMQEAASELSYSTSAAEVYDVDSEGGAITFSVVCDNEWGVSTAEEWIATEVDVEAGRVVLNIAKNEGEEQLVGEVELWIGCGEQRVEQRVTVNVGTRAENPYYKLIGDWEITATKWFYSPNGSLNSLDYSPNASEYYLIFSMEEAEYGETLTMRNFLYPGTSLEVRYDKATGGIVIPFGWTVLYYDVFFYVTLVSSTQFAYASLEVDATPDSDVTSLTLRMPSVDGYNYVGFGLWTYSDDGSKVALGSNYRPTMFPMGDIVFKKR